jgi:predicted phosphodiesterase
MKIAICSDVHLEFGQLELFNDEGIDVLILSGDICVARDLMEHDPYGIVDFGKSSRYHKFFQECSARFKHVIYVAGNHEHYHGDFKHTIPDLKSRLAYLTNLHILDKEIVDIGDVRFIGSTLWTDMNKEDPITLHAMKRMMNDFRIVDNSNREVSFKTYDANGEFNGFHTRVARFCPEDAVEEHKKCLDYIKLMYSETPPWMSVVVVGHHTPSHTSCHPRYKDDQVMNGGYHSDLTEFILDRPGIKLWTHGHTHELFDYMIGSTRVVCNPRGYDGYEDIADTFKLKVVEV